MPGTGPYVQIAALEIDPARLTEYRSAAARQIRAAIDGEPGVLALHAVADPDDPSRMTVFEIYRDRQAYEDHLRAAHFLAYKDAVASMVMSLRLTPVVPVILAAKPDPN
jgi:quinol monooxygenase YgiN